MLAMAEMGLVSTQIDAANLDLSPYRSGLLTKEQIGRYGIDGQQSVESFQQELAWLQQQKVPLDTVIPIKAMSLVEEDLVSVCKTLEEANLLQVFELWASASHVTSAVMSAMSSARVQRLVSDGEVSCAAEACGQGAAIVINSVQEAQQKLLLYGRNGLVAAHVGLYPDPGSASAIQHLEVPLTPQCGGAKVGL